MPSMTTAVTIPKELARKGDLVLIPREEYEALVRARRAVQPLRSVKTFTATPAEKRMFARARKNFAAGKYLTLDQLKHELGRSR